MFGQKSSMNTVLKISSVAGLLILSACQTSGSDGILSSVLPGKKDAAATATDQTSASARPGQNPNANTRLINTRNALSDYCPAVRIRAGTEVFRTFPNGADKENLNNIKYQATITKVARECNYVGQNLEIKVGARGRVITGPKGDAGSLEMPIRVAVQQGSCSRHFKLYRQKADIAAGASSTNFQFVDDTIVLPAPKSTNVRMYIGFDEGPYGEPSTKPCTG